MNGKFKKHIPLIIFVVFSVLILTEMARIQNKLDELTTVEPVEVHTVEQTESQTFPFSDDLTSPENPTETTVFVSSAEAGNPVGETAAVTETTSVCIQAPSETEETTYYNENTTIIPPNETDAYDVKTTFSIDADPNFYITLSGNKYHKAECSYLRKSRILVTPEEIIEGGYEPCKVCMKEAVQ